MSKVEELARFATKSKAEHDIEILPLTTVKFTKRILSFDQSLANTGWCLIEAGEVMLTGNLKTEKVSKGHEDNLERTMLIYRKIKGLIETSNLEMDDLIVHETPPVGGRMARPESSLLAAAAIRIAADGEWPQVVMIGAQRAKKRWTGNGNAGKAMVKAGLLKLHPYLKKISPMNQAIVDAIAIGLLAAEMYDGS